VLHIADFDDALGDEDEYGGNATLDGTVNVSFINGYVGADLAVGDYFDIVVADDISGYFSNLPEGYYDGGTVLPALPSNMRWYVSYGDHGNATEEVRLTVANHPDVEATGFSNDAYGGLVVDYEIHSADSGYEADPFSISIYKSYDGVNPTGGAMQTINVTSSGDLTAGSHSASFSPNFSAAWEEHSLIAVVDSGDVLDEADETNNVAEFESGAFLSYGGTLSIFGDDGANTIEITESGTDYLVDIDSQTVLTIAPARGSRKQSLIGVLSRSQGGGNLLAA
jgi:hypothetical protein